MITELLLTLLGGILLTALVKRFMKIQQIEKIPGPPSLPLIGNALDFSGSHVELFQTFEKFCKFGDGISRFYLGTQAYCLLYRAKTVETLLSSNSIIDKSHDYSYLHPWLGTGLLTSTGSKWRSRRKMLTPTFHFKILEDFVEIFQKQSLRFVNKLECLAEGKEFDIFPLVTLCTLDIIMETAMGKDIDAQSDSECDYVKAVTGYSSALQTRQTKPWLHPDILYRLLGYEKQDKKYLNVLHEMSLSAIKIRKEQYRLDKERKSDEQQEEIVGKKKRLAFLDLLLEESDTDTERLTDEDLREEVDTFMFEGHDTTASAIAHSLYFLARHPDIQERVYRELDEVLGDGDCITMDTLRDLKLLEACVKEALRLCPSVPLIGRQLTKPTLIGGYEVPAGVTLMVSVYTLHQDPEQFPDPMKYDPNRFLGDSGNRHPYAYVPFSAGPRNCIGQKFALLEEKMVIASVVRRFKLRSTQRWDQLCLMGEIILRPEKGIMVTLAKRA